ncbi:hypothetical protein MtrunA17_Chr2g0332051 [Medicago truncatula]|uniref:Uncharacterized protein n=1 Tax=Medicago truncatula TaxID=3880 RepID=A0A396JJG3_MEDTR|nr:hypothetical protein MtrunA17_Chr2g0332051 [Medicago truncatula]
MNKGNLDLVCSNILKLQQNISNIREQTYATWKHRKHVDAESEVEAEAIVVEWRGWKDRTRSRRC